MNISKELIAVIRSMAKQSQVNRYGFDFYKTIEEEVKRVCQLPRHADTVRRIGVLNKRVAEINKELPKLHAKLGCVPGTASVFDREAFEKGGGVYPKPREVISAHEVLDQIARAETKEQVQKILKANGIVWAL